jgi:hypothetical protein
MRIKQELRLMGAVNLMGIKGIELVDAGKRHVDQLLRALIPYYVADKTVNFRGVEITSGDVSRFWAKYRVKFSGPAAAKALREHVGYARRTRQGLQITPNGTKYVEAALRR